MTVQDVPRQTAAAEPPPPGGARPLLIGLGISFAVLSILAGALNVIGSIGRDSVHSQTTYQGIRVLDIDVSVESVQVVAGQGDVTQLASFDEIRPIVAKVPDAQVLTDLDATVAWATAVGLADASKVAITGFCWGGRIVWLYAATARP